MKSKTDIKKSVAELEAGSSPSSELEMATGRLGLTPTKAEELYKSLFELSPVGIATIDLKGKITACNAAMMVMGGGYSKDEIVGEYFWKVPAMRARDIPTYLKLFKSLLSGKEVKPFEAPFLYKDGSPGWTEARAKQLRVGGKLLGAILTMKDITERKATEAKLTESESYLTGLMDSVHTGIMVIDPTDHSIVEVNSYAAKMIGTGKDEILGRQCQKFVCPGVNGHCPVTDLGQTIDLSERFLLKANGEQLPVLKSVSKVRRNGKSYLVESFVDVSKRKEVEERLKRSEER
jgi:PAS domain S-box-containing protein